MMKKFKAGLALLLATGAVFMTGCTQGRERFMFGTGGTAGTYYSYGGVLAQYMKNYAGIKVTAVSTGASKVNLQSIQDGDFQLGFTQSDVMTYAWEGTRSFETDGGTQDFRVLGSLYPETVQLMTMNDDIQSVDDLKGKRVSIGEGGSGVYFNAMDVLNAAGITMDDIKPQYQSFEDSKEALKDGKIDAAFIVAAAATTAITELATTNGMHLINIDGELCENLLEQCPYYQVQEIPANTYPKQKEVVRTVAVKATLVVSKDVSEEDVYKLTAAIFDHKDAIKKENAQGEKMSLETATSVTTAPYHCGAAKYYKEHGIEVKTDKDFDLKKGD